MTACIAKASLFAKRKGVLRGGEAGVASSIDRHVSVKNSLATVSSAWRSPARGRLLGGDSGFVQARHMYVSS